MRNGYMLLFRFRGIPVLAHWSLLVGLLVFTRGFDLAAWIGFFLIILVHEAGHALLARRFRLHVYRIEMHGLGGLCAYDGWATPFQHAVIAWGGVLAQGTLYLFAWSLTILHLFPSGVGGRILQMFLGTNLLIIFFNLLPLPFFDGGTAWKLFPMLYRAWQRAKRRVRKKRRPGSGGGDVVSMDAFRRSEDRDPSSKKDDDDKPLLH